MKDKKEFIRDVHVFVEETANIPLSVFLKLKDKIITNKENKNEKT